MNDRFIDDNGNIKKKSQIPSWPQFSNSEICQFLYEYELLITYISCISPTYINKKNKRNGKFRKRGTKFDPDTIAYLLHSWGTNKNQVKRLRERAMTAAIARGVNMDTARLSLFDNSCYLDAEDNSTNIIDDKVAAEKWFTTEKLFVRNHVSNNDSDNVPYHTKLEIAKEAFRNCSEDINQQWELKRRSHLEKHARIKIIIIDSLQKNPSISYFGLANVIDYWCSVSTIQRWVTSREGYMLFPERVIPCLSDKQRKEHLEFARLFNNNWGLGGGKYLLIHYDEKWFWGMLLRNTAKTFDGLEAAIMRAYHKNHISKTMGVAVVAMAFDDTLENGGTAVKLILQRCQSNKVAQRKVTKDGKVVRVKGDMYLVDCNVTGSTCGTSDDPKFPLKNFFETAVFPEVEKLVTEGGRFHGYTPIFQGDNAGPHRDADFHNFVKKSCDSKGWKWQPQAPQMPHMNVLDLAVFPAMSRRHCQLSRSLHGSRVLTSDEIWNAAVCVWNNLPSSKIANAFVQAKRIANKIVSTRGGNEFLSNKKGNISGGVRADFLETDGGNKRRDGRIMKFIGTNPKPQPKDPMVETDSLPSNNIVEI